MAFSVADLSADEIALAADDKPMLSSNALPDGALSTKWVVGTRTGNVASANDDATGFESYRLYDGLPGRVSKPNAANTQFTLFFSFFNKKIEFDWFGLLNTNLYTLGTTDLRLQIANNSLMSSGLGNVFDSVDLTSALSSERRWADVTLGTGATAKRATDVEYARLQITCSSGVPQIGQVVFGRRRQLRHSPMRPWDPTNQHASMYDAEAPNGTLYRTAKKKGQRHINAQFRQNTAADQALITSWRDDIDEGRLPFFYHDKPNAAPMDFQMFNVTGPEAALAYPFTTYNLRDFTLEGVEQGPSFLAAEV